MFKKTLLLAGASYFFIQKKTCCSPQPPLSMILRGAYENKIRRYSPPQKIFDVFATIYDHGRLYMSMTDLLKAICFYNYSLSDETHTQGFNPPSILKFLGRSNKFEIYDYFILARFLACDKQQIQRYYDKRNVPEMNKQQFKQCKYEANEVIIKQVCADYVNHIKQSILIQSRQFKPSNQQFEKKAQTIANSMFQGIQSISARQLHRFRRNMIEELYQFQFLMFPIENETIDGVDFARSIIKYVEPNKTKKYMQRIKKMNHLEKVRIDKKAYKAFHIYMWANMTQIQSLLNERGAMSTKQLAQLINTYINKKGTVTQQQIDVVVKILDYDDSGFLQKKQVLGVLKNLQYYSSVKSGQLTFTESLKHDFEKLVNKLKKIEQIIEQ